MTDSPTSDDSGLDLAHLRDLLSLLQEKRVSTFQQDATGSLVIVFKEDGEGFAPSALPAMVADDGHGTSNRPVAGFERKPAGGFRHPSLWSQQGGKALRLDGKLE